MNSNKTFRLFISSTFNDFRRERYVLQTKVFPSIKQYAAEKGYTFQPIDLRWGVSAEAQLDQKTLELCLEEVRTCKSHMHPNFLIMVGDRYGWVPLPYAIEKKEFEHLKSIVSKISTNIQITYRPYKHYPDPSNSDHFTEHQKSPRETTASELLEEWYILDYNQIPVSYILKERSKESEYSIFENWEGEESALRKILQDAVNKAINTGTISEKQQHKYFLSATEAEVVEGIIPYLRPTPFQNKLLSKKPELEIIDPKQIFGFFRNIDPSSQKNKDDKFIIDDDDYAKAQRFKDDIKKVIPEKNCLESSTRQIDKENLDETYLAAFKERVITFLKTTIDAQNKLRFTSLQIEQEAQDYYALTKLQGFLTTNPVETLLSSIRDYIRVPEPSPAFVIYGPSGRGKSSLMAQAISHAQKYQNFKVVYRFVGATPNSSTTKEILQSIFEEIDLDIRHKEKKFNDIPFQEFSKYFYKKIISININLVIFIDAVDQLGNEDQFLWLPRELPANVKIIISALDDETYPEDSGFFQTLRSKTSNLHMIPRFDEPLTLLRQILASEGRTILAEQESYFLQQYASSQSPLYVTIAAQELQHWKSSVVGGVGEILSAGQKEIIQEFITNLEKIYHHNPRFVRKVLGYLYASSDGLSESELLQLLNTDEAFIQAMAPETWHDNPTKELPLIHWSRLHTQLKPFLSLKSQDGEELIYFFHREFEDAVNALPNKKEEHKAIIQATQKLITKYQHDPFNQNRWGKLYSQLTTDYAEEYNDQVIIIFSSNFVSELNSELWIDEYIKYVLNKASEYDYGFNKKAYKEYVKIKHFNKHDFGNVQMFEKMGEFYHKLGGYEYLHVDWKKGLKNLLLSIKLLSYNQPISNSTKEILSQSYGRIGEMFTRVAQKYKIDDSKKNSVKIERKIHKALEVLSENEKLNCELFQHEKNNIEYNRKLGVVYERFANAYRVIESNFLSQKENINTRKYFFLAIKFKFKSYNRNNDTNGFSMRKIFIVIANYYLEYGMQNKAILYIKKLLGSLSDDKIKSAIQKNNQYEIEQYSKIYKLAAQYINTEYDLDYIYVSKYLKKRGLSAEY